MNNHPASKPASAAARHSSEIPGLRLGLDFAGVIIRSGVISRPGGTIFDDEVPRSSHLRPGALAAVSELVSRTSGQVWIVSKAREEMQPVIRGYLEAIDFFARTGLSPHSVHFTLDRAGKREVCLENRITHFLDDRLEVLELLEEAVPYRFWFTEEDERDRVPSGVCAVVDWQEALDRLSPLSNSP